MKIIENIKYVLVSMAVLILYMILSNIAVDISQKPLELNSRAQVSTDMEISNYKLYDDGLVLWDQHNLQFFNLDGDLLDQVLGNGYFTNVYLYNDDVLILDKQLSVLYNYNRYGELEEKIDLYGPVHGILNTEDGYFLHLRDETTFKESINEFDNKNPIYETNKFIIWYQSQARRQAVGEMTSENYAYRSSVLIKEGSRSNRYNFDNETILDLEKIGGKYLAVTNKNLYRLQDGKKEKVPIEKFRDYVFEENSVAILTEKNLTIYDNNLKIIDQYDLDINASGIFKHHGGYFIYGGTDLIGFLGQDREFSQKVNQLIHSATASGDHIAIIYKQSAEIFEFVEKGKDSNGTS